MWLAMFLDISHRPQGFVHHGHPLSGVILTHAGKLFQIGPKTKKGRLTRFAAAGWASTPLYLGQNTD